MFKSCFFFFQNLPVTRILDNLMEMKSHPVRFFFSRDLKNVFPILVKNIESVVKSVKSPSSFIEKLNTSIKGGGTLVPLMCLWCPPLRYRLGKDFAKSHIINHFKLFSLDVKEKLLKWNFNIHYF